MENDELVKIINILDIACYGKACNFIELDTFIDERPVFYSRDLCKSISLSELIRWYLERVEINQIDLMMHLIDCYRYYTDE